MSAWIQRWAGNKSWLTCLCPKLCTRQVSLASCPATSVRLVGRLAKYGCVCPAHHPAPSTPTPASEKRQYIFWLVRLSLLIYHLVPSHLLPPTPADNRGVASQRGNKHNELFIPRENNSSAVSYNMEESLQKFPVRRWQTDTSRSSHTIRDRSHWATQMSLVFLVTLTTYITLYNM